MKDRRSLVDGLKQTPALDRKTEQDFVFQHKSPAAELPKSASPSTGPALASAGARSPLSTRIRSDYAEALKRASLQRQLEKVEPNTISEILEVALEAWLTSNGHLSRNPA
jgi:hypothetical protein